MADLSGETVASQAGDWVGTSETRPDKQSGEELSACLGGTYWSRLPVEMQIEIVKQENLDDGDKLNLLCAYPELLSVISKSYPHDNANEGKDTETEPPDIHINYSSEKKMFSVEMAEFSDSRQPPRIFGLKHNLVVLTNLDSERKHAAVLLNALELTSTTTRKFDFGANEVDFQLLLAFVKVLKPSSLELDFDNNEKWTTLNELIEAAPALFELNGLIVHGPVHADDDSLLSHLPKFPPSLCFNNSLSRILPEEFLYVGHVVKFLRTLVSTKFEEGSPAAIALKRIVNWTFEIKYETETGKGATTNGYKLLSELAADIIPPGSENKRRIFKLRLAVGDEQHVIYVKEEIDNRHEFRLIQLANQTSDFCTTLDSPTSSITSDTDEQMFSSDGDSDSDMVDSDEEGDEFMDDDH
ncbi:hypothetical protein WR25_11254 [Diploscapter pachys]|uniref:Uncharacterized protein n=1 Tax=Diploscapter pachys TaxID=2018661 RepID=A0A2A2KP19_9BILA|nr:hypothetical protein WR25_11254 [Diploscapter pachys]